MATSREAGTALPPSLAANPRLGDWLRLRPDGVVEVRSGKVELGQGVLTALAQVAAEELDIDVGRVRMVAAVTGISPDEGYTSGSMSIQYSGAALRVACADARAVYLGVAGRPGGTCPQTCSPFRTAPLPHRTDGPRVTGSSRSRRAARPPGHGSGRAQGGRGLPGRRYQRAESGPARAASLPRPRFVHDMALEGMLYGRVIRPPSRGATLLDVGHGTGAGAARSRDRRAGREFPGRDRRTRGGGAARRRPAPGGGQVGRSSPHCPMRTICPPSSTSAPAETSVLAESAPPASAAARPAARSHEATYHRPYLAHAAMGPSSATALARDVTDGAGDETNGGNGGDVRLEIWTHSQGVYMLRRALARTLKLTEEQVRVRHIEGAGCYGHNGADDAAMGRGPARPGRARPAGAGGLVAFGPAWLGALRAGRRGPHRRRCQRTR